MDCSTPHGIAALLWWWHRRETADPPLLNASRHRSIVVGQVGGSCAHENVCSTPHGIAALLWLSDLASNLSERACSTPHGIAALLWIRFSVGVCAGSLLNASRHRSIVVVLACNCARTLTLPPTHSSTRYEPRTASLLPAPFHQFHLKNQGNSNKSCTRLIVKEHGWMGICALNRITLRRRVKTARGA